MAHMLPALLPLCAAALVLSPAEPSPKRAWRDRIKAQRHIRPHVNPLQRRYLEQSTDHLPAALDFADKTLPLHLDIGCGKGHYCADLAEARPDRNIVGVEIREQLVEEATRLCREVTDGQPALCGWQRERARRADLRGASGGNTRVRLD